MLKQPQRGQALVAVLVVMMLIFLLAGAVSIGATNVLGRTDSTHDVAADDLAVQSAVAIAADHAANRRPCGARLTPDFTFGKNVGFCARVTEIPPAEIPPAAVPLNGLTLTQRGPDGCSVTDLNNSAGTVKWVIILTAHWQPNSYAYIGDGGGTACPASRPLVPPGCFADRLPNQYSVAYPVALKCTPASTHPSLYVRNGPGQPRSALSMQLGSSPGTGVLYVTVTSTGLASPRDYEEAILYSPQPNVVYLKLETAAP